MFLKKDGWLNLVLERRTLQNPHDRALVCMEGSVPRFVFIQQLMGNFTVICDIFDLLGNVVSKQRVSKLDFLSYSDSPLKAIKPIHVHVLFN